MSGPQLECFVWACLRDGRPAARWLARDAMQRGLEADNPYARLCATLAIAAQNPDLVQPGLIASVRRELERPWG